MSKEEEATYAIIAAHKKAEQITKAAWDLAATTVALELYILRNNTGIETGGSYLETWYKQAIAMSHGEWITKEQAKQEAIDAAATELAFYGGNGKRTKERIEQLKQRYDEIRKGETQ